jgi:pimeloyl-ACP methyl ester carboxylesterase
LHLYDRLLPHLSPPRRVVAFDFLGWGRSDKPSGYPYTTDNQVGDLDAVITQLKLGPVVLVAHDASGPPAIDWALAHPERVEGLVLLNTYYCEMPTLRRPEATGFSPRPWPEVSRGLCRGCSGIGSSAAFLDDSGQVDEQLVALSAVGRAVHHGKQFRLQIRRQAQDSLGLAGVWHIAGQRSLLQLLHRFPSRLDQIRSGDGLDVAEMMKQVGTKQHFARFFEQHTSVPSMRDVRGPIEPIPILTSAQDFVGRHAARWADGEIIHAHKLSDESADRLGIGCEL